MNASHHPTTPTPAPDVDSILYAFAVEPRHDRATLDSYLRRHPELAEDLIDLSLEIRLMRAEEQLAKEGHNG
jgi:hypothetical protein